jgi:hypothetical protein
VKHPEHLPTPLKPVVNRLLVHNSIALSAADAPIQECLLRLGSLNPYSRACWSFGGIGMELRQLLLSSPCTMLMHVNRCRLLHTRLCPRTQTKSSEKPCLALLRTSHLTLRFHGWKLTTCNTLSGADILNTDIGLGNTPVFTLAPVEQLSVGQTLTLLVCRGSSF